MTLDTSGPMSSTPFAFYDPDLSCWRTSQGTFPWDSIPSSVTLPRAGSMRSGALYERQTPGPAIDESGCSSLLPTPIVPNGGRTLDSDVTFSGKAAYKPDGTKRQVDLRNFVERLLPTPVANDDHKSPAEHLRKKVESGPSEVITSLTVMARQASEAGAWSNRLLPTPRTSDANGGGTHGEGGLDLRTAVKLLPTPVAADSHGHGWSTTSDTLVGVARSIGATTDEPSSDGNDGTDQHPDRSTRRAG